MGKMIGMEQEYEHNELPLQFRNGYLEERLGARRVAPAMVEVLGRPVHSQPVQLSETAKNALAGWVMFGTAYAPLLYAGYRLGRGESVSGYCISVPTVLTGVVAAGVTLDTVLSGKKMDEAVNITMGMSMFGVAALGIGTLVGHFSR